MRQRKVTTPLVMHSDRGSQYFSAAYLEAAGLKLSYSKKGILTTTHVSNRFIRSSNASGLTVLKFATTIMPGNSFLSISTLFLIPFVFTVIAISARLMTLKICTIFPSFHLQFCRVIQSFAFWSVYCVCFIDIRADLSDK